MTNRKDGPDKAPPRPAGDAGKRIHATIDLKATEVAAAEAKAAAASSSDNATSAERIAKAGETVAAGEASKASVAGRTSAAASTASSGPATTGTGTGERSTGAASPGKATSTPSAGGKAATGGATAAASTATAAAATVASAAAAPVGKKRGGFLSHLMAAAVGGAVILLGAEHMRPQLTELGLLPSAAAPIAADTTERLAALEKSLAVRPVSAAAPAPELLEKLASAEQRLARLEESTKAITPLAEAQARLAAEAETLAEKVAAAGAGGPAGVGERVAKLEDTLATMSRAATADPERAGRLPQLAAITGKLADLELALTSRATALRTDLLQEVETRIGTATEASELARSGTTRLDREVTQLRTEAARIGQRIETLKAGSDRLEQTLRVVQEETGGLRAGLDGLQGDVKTRFEKVAKPEDVQKAVTPVAGKVAALEKSVQGVVAAEADRRQNAERIVLALELANLKRAMERGSGFAAELAEVQRVSGGKLDLTALMTHRTKGVAPLSDLVRDFRPLAARIIDAESDDAEAGVVDRLLSGARSIVRVRKTTHAADDTSLEAVVGRMERALKDGRLGDVMTAAGGLSEKAKAPATDWLGKVAARQSVDKALADIEASLKASLGATAVQKGTR